MFVFLSSLTMLAIGTSLTMTMRLAVMSLARQSEKPTSAAARQHRPVATAAR